MNNMKDYAERTTSELLKPSQSKMNGSKLNRSNFDFDYAFASIAVVLYVVAIVVFFAQF